MEITAKIGQKNYAVNLTAPLDISIPVRFDEGQIRAFGAPPATRTPFTDKDFIGDVARGGSCNCDLLTFSPHLHGTHTECVGHISRAAISVHEALKDSLIPATLVTIAPQQNMETYDPKLRAGDDVITKKSLETALAAANHDFLPALIVRTKRRGEGLPPFFSIEAMRYIVSLGVQHLLVDVPSIDRLDDEGKLTNHHIFWGVESGSHEVKKPSPKTVTELISVADSIADGNYVLNLQLAPIVGDASPSRPLLYGIKTL